MRSGAMSDAKRRNGQRLALGLAGLAAVWLVGVWPPPVWWRTHWPRCTAMMRLRGTAVSYQPSALSRISPLLQRMVIIGEDSRFRTHHGIDVTEIADAVDPGARRQYFGVPASQLGDTQAAALAATLPHPRTSNPVFSPALMLARRDLILARYHGVPVYIPPEEELDSLFAIPAITPPVIPPLPDTLPDSLGMDTGAVKRGRIRRDSM